MIGPGVGTRIRLALVLSGLNKNSYKKVFQTKRGKKQLEVAPLVSQCSLFLF